MSRTNQYKITGAFPSKGSFFDKEKNQEIAYDSTKFYIEMPLADGKGFATVEMKLPSSDDYHKYFGAIDLPAVADVTFLETTKGGKRIETITNIEFKKLVKGAQ